MKTLQIIVLLFASFILTHCTNNNASNEVGSASKLVKSEALALNQNMYVIEREIPGAGDLTSEQLKEISQTSCGVLENMGPEITWIQSYVTGDKVYCVYTAPNVEMILEHANQGGFPANQVSLVSAIIDPNTAK